MVFIIVGMLFSLLFLLLSNVLLLWFSYNLVQQNKELFQLKLENEEELDRCYEAMENCPVEAIGDDDV